MRFFIIFFKNHFLLKIIFWFLINLTTRGPLYTCLVLVQYNFTRLQCKLQGLYHNILAIPLLWKFVIWNFAQTDSIFWWFHNVFLSENGIEIKVDANFLFCPSTFQSFLACDELFTQVELKLPTPQELVQYDEGKKEYPFVKVNYIWLEVQGNEIIGLFPMISSIYILSCTS